MSDDRPIPLEQNDRARMLLERLREGPASTVELQRGMPLVHVARQVWELRHWYGFRIRTTHLPSRVAVYALDEPDPIPPPPAPVQQAAGILVDGRGRPVFGQEVRRRRTRR